MTGDRFPGYLIYIGVKSLLAKRDLQIIDEHKKSRSLRDGEAFRQ
jgi:hypothetical protein